MKKKYSNTLWLSVAVISSFYYLSLFSNNSPILFTDHQSANKKALIVAIADYPDELGWRDLNADNDVVILTETLKAQGFKESIFM